MREVYVESGVGAAFDDGAVVWSFDADLWGRCAQGRSVGEALAAWADEHGPCRVVETIEGDDFRYYCEHGVMPVHPDDTIEPPAKVIRRMDEAPVAPQPDTEAPARPTDVDTPEAGSDKTE